MKKSKKASYNVTRTMVGQNKVSVKRIPTYLGRAFIVLWVVFTIVIITWVLLASFSTTKEIFTGNLLKSGLHFNGYVSVFTKYNIWLNFGNSLMNTVIACAGLVLVCAPAAYALSKFEFKMKKPINIAYAAAMGLPSVMLLAPLFMTIVSIGMNKSIATIWLIYICTGIPSTMFYLLGFFSNIPSSLQESALVEGCTHVKAFWKVVFPLAQPGVLTITIFNFIGYWNEFVWALVFCSAPERKPLAVALQNIVQAMGNLGNYTGIFAAVIIVFVPTFILFIILSDFIMGDITAGAVKG